MKKSGIRFRPKRGQVDYTNARWAPVINCVVKHKNKILIVRRSQSLKLYPNYWNGISGFLDDERDLETKVREELKEEAGISAKDIIAIHLGEIFDQEEPRYKKTWVVHPVLVKVASSKIELDWEANGYKWINPSEIKNYKLLPGFDTVLKKLSKFIRK